MVLPNVTWNRKLKFGVFLISVLFLMLIGVNIPRYIYATFRFLYDVALNIKSYECPDLDDHPVIVFPSHYTRLSLSRENSLCRLTLVERPNDGRNETIYPIARSYEGNNWEAARGPFNVKFECLRSTCRTSIPKLPSENHVYILKTSSYSMNDIIIQDDASRFLEQATFGSTATTIADLTKDTSNEQELHTNLIQWMKTQMYATPLTSHREFFRKRSNTRLKTTQRIGSPIHPCSPHTRWHLCTFTPKDHRASIQISRTNDNSAYLLSVNNIPRTEVDSVEVEGNIFLEVGQSYIECNRGNIQRSVGSDFNVMVGESCKKLLGGNPAIKFSSLDAEMPLNTIPLVASTMNDFVAVGRDNKNDNFMNAIGLEEPMCSFLHTGVYPVYLVFSDGRWLSFDPIINLQDNSLESIIPDGGGSQEALGAACSNVPRTFLNEDSCVLSSAAGSCGPLYDLPNTKVPLTIDSIPKLQKLTNRYVYAISGLKPMISPCVLDLRSRWERIDSSQCEPNKSIDTDTVSTIIFLLSKAEGSDLRDITLHSRSNHQCDIASTTPSSATVIAVSIEKACWRLIHPDEYNVFDMTSWVSDHPGGPKVIKQFAIKKKSFLEFPNSHDISRWENHKKLFTFIGRSGETIQFRDLPSHLKLESIRKEFDSNNAPNKNADRASNFRTQQGILVCGSPGEIRNNNSLGETGYNMKIDNGADALPGRLLDQQKQFIWPTIVLSAPDQLRQRMAWALSQLLAISYKDVDTNEQTEFTVSYYDIFVRNAFGNYRDVLREVAYSPSMAIMLSYHASKSTAYNLKHLKSFRFPDENFAREIMQLFSIGTVMLNLDGTTMLDPISGSPIPTYTNDHIMSFARAWTAFDFQSARGNIEMYENSENLIDPMQIIPDWRDVFPKINLSNGYIGDAYPLCVDMPNQFFLRKGARYRLLGSSTMLELQSNEPPNINAPMKSFPLTIRSKLYTKLCNPKRKEGSECRLQSEVILDENIDCDGLECEVDTLRLVKVTDTVYFEYVDPPCVRLAVYEDAKKVSNSKNTEVMCADPKAIAASEACCMANNNISNARNCNYVGERLSFDLAIDKCNSIGQSLCAFTVMKSCSSDCCLSNKNYFWQDASCTIQVKIDKAGYVALVLQPENTDEESVHADFQTNSKLFFPVHWSEGFPSVTNECGTNVCELLDDACLCNVKIIETSVFDSIPGDEEEIVSQLHVGSFSPDSFNSDAPRFMARKRRHKGIKAHLHQRSSYDKSTIFEVKADGNDVKYFRNIRSDVIIVDLNGKATEFSFRNPPHFMNMAEPEKRDAQYETDAVLNDYFYHPNTAPFLAKYFIQRFGFSNPSPRYIKEVATAFANGLYGGGFGSGQYGDLGAMVAAIILDREARSRVATLDPTFGSLREPILKLMGYMRSMELIASEKYPDIRLKDITSRIGQMAHEIDSVFSFFEQDYAVGPIKDLSLVAPEGRRYDTNTIIGLLNGLYSLTKYGLTQCNEGFAFEIPNINCKSMKEGDYRNSQAKLNYKPSEPRNAKKVVDDLASILTAGRLNKQSRLIIENEYSRASDNDSGLRLAQELIISSPEFHSTSKIKFSGKAREKRLERDTNTKKDFKSFVYLFLGGGADSFNVLIPHSGCKDKDLYAEYSLVRGTVAIPKESLLTISAKGSSQVCNTFGIHPSLSVLHSLYQDGDAIFLANTGVLFEPVTKDNWRKKTRTQLFAHNVQNRDTQQVDVYQEIGGTGVVGRMADALTNLGYNTGSFALADDKKSLVGEPLQSPAIYDLNEKVLKAFSAQFSNSRFNMVVGKINNATDIESGIFGKTWSQLLDQSLTQMRDLVDGTKNVNVSESFPNNGIGNQLKIVSSAIQARDTLKTNRQFFMARQEGFDSHANYDNLNRNFAQINEALSSFVKEMKSLGVWDNVLILVGSEFSRTLTPNSNGGTDHGWGGNYFVIGGGLEGGRIVGKYPDDLTINGPNILTHGRVIPSMSWDSVMNGVARWVGITNETDLIRVVPNRMKFSNILDENFVSSIQETSGSIRSSNFASSFMFLCILCSFMLSYVAFNVV